MCIGVREFLGPLSLTMLPLLGNGLVACVLMSASGPLAGFSGALCFALHCMSQIYYALKMHVFLEFFVLITLDLLT